MYSVNSVLCCSAHGNFPDLERFCLCKAMSVQGFVWLTAGRPAAIITSVFPHCRTTASAVARGQWLLHSPRLWPARCPERWRRPSPGLTASDPPGGCTASAQCPAAKQGQGGISKFSYSSKRSHAWNRAERMLWGSGQTWLGHGTKKQTHMWRKN